MDKKTTLRCAKLIQTNCFRLSLDCLFLSFPCKGQSCVRVMAWGDGLPEEMEFVPVRAENSFCQRVVQSNSTILSNDHFGGPRDGRCGLMQAEGMRAYMGVPIQSLDGLPFAALSTASRLPRIWSRFERDGLLAAAFEIENAISQATHLSPLPQVSDIYFW